jgi:hypothetical protein
MLDITYCLNEFCPLFSECLRNPTKIGPGDRMSVVDFEPVRETDQITECEHFIDGQEDEEDEWTGI